MRRSVDPLNRLFRSLLFASLLLRLAR